MNLANGVQAPPQSREMQLPIMYQNRQVVLFNTLPFFGAAWQRKCSHQYLIKLNRLALATGVSQSLPAWCPAPTRDKGGYEATTGDSLCVLRRLTASLSCGAPRTIELTVGFAPETARH
jgi:hypothetical protein